MDTIGEMIESLDDAADSSSIVQVLHVDGTVDLGLIQERLKDLMKVTPGSRTARPAASQARTATTWNAATWPAAGRESGRGGRQLRAIFNVSQTFRRSFSS